MKKYTILAVSALLAPMSALAHAGEDDFAHHAMIEGGAHGWNGMMGWGAGWSLFAFLFLICTIVWIVVGILAAIWLWKQIQKK